MRCSIQIKGHLDPSWQDWFEGRQCLPGAAGTRKYIIQECIPVEKSHLGERSYRAMLGDAFDAFGTILKQFRKRRHLTQQQLAEALGVHRNTIGRWEEGSFLPESKALVLDLARSLNLDEQEARQLLDASLITPVPVWSVPYPRNPFFTGREETLEWLHAHLGLGQQSALTQSCALLGLGGIGKTQIALEYAYRYSLEYRAIFWIGAETVEQIHASLLRVAERLALPERTETERQCITAAVQRWLEAHGEWLLIWDNLEDLSLPHQWLPLANLGTVLITTRSQALGTFAHGINLVPMKQEESLLFVLRRARLLEPEATRTQLQQFAVSSPDEYTAALKLVWNMGGLPLALDQAGAYIEETGCRLADYLRCYEQQRGQLLDRRGIAGGEHPHAVTSTFLLARERVEQASDAAADLLRVCAFLYVEAIPEELFATGAAYLGPVLEVLANDQTRFDQTLAILRRFSLIQRQTQIRTLSLHRLVQVVLRDNMEVDEERVWSGRVVRMVNAAFPEPSFEVWAQCERYLIQALACVPLIEGSANDFPEASELLYKVGSYLLDRGHFKEAEPLLERAVMLGNHAFGAEHSELIPRLMKWGELFFKQGKYQQAEALLQRILVIGKRVLDSDHPAIAEVFHNLASLSWEQGKYEVAEPLYRQALQIREQRLGNAHPATASTLGALGFVYMTQGKYEQAEPLYQRALQIQEQYSGPEHPETALRLSNLAYLYRNEEKYECVEPLYQRALHIQEQQLGAEHARTMDTLHNLATFYRIQGKYELAEPLYQRVLSVREQQLEPDAPILAYTLLGLAIVYREQEQYGLAEPLFERALSIRKQRLGEEHLDTIIAQHELGILYRKQSRDELAEPLLQRALAICEERWPEHPQTKKVRDAYGQLHTHTQKVLREYSPPLY